MEEPPGVTGAQQTGPGLDGSPSDRNREPVPGPQEGPLEGVGAPLSTGPVPRPPGRVACPGLLNLLLNLSFLVLVFCFLGPASAPPTSPPRPASSCDRYRKDSWEDSAGRRWSPPSNHQHGEQAGVRRGRQAGVRRLEARGKQPHPRAVPRAGHRPEHAWGGAERRGFLSCTVGAPWAEPPAGTWPDPAHPAPQSAPSCWLLLTENWALTARAPSPGDR